MIVKLWLSNIRILAFLSVVVCGGLASMSKTFGIYPEYIFKLESALGGDWVLHLFVAVALGFTSVWAMDKAWIIKLVNDVNSSASLAMTETATHRDHLISSTFFLFLVQHSLFILSFLMVSIDETLQLFWETREFSFFDLKVNITGLVLGLVFYRMVYCKIKRFLLVFNT